jgi:hypothetical protein
MNAAFPSNLAAKIAFFLKQSEGLAAMPNPVVRSISAQRFPKEFDAFVRRLYRQRRKGDRYRSMEETARKWTSGSIKTPHPRQRELLSDFFSSIFGRYIEEHSLPQIDPHWFRNEIDPGVVTHAFSLRSGSFRINFSIPHEKIRSLWREGIDDMAGNLCGWKIMFRRAIENTGRIAIELVRIQLETDRIFYQYWFRARGTQQPKEIWKNEGTFIPLQDIYWGIGIHDSPQGGAVRFRSLALQKTPFQSFFSRVQTGLMCSSHPAHGYPVAAKFIWISVDPVPVESGDALAQKVVDFHETFREVETRLRKLELAENPRAIVKILDSATDNRLVLLCHKL